MTGNDLFDEALLIAGVYTYPKQTPSAEALATCQLGLNNLLAEWNAQGLAIYSVAPKTFSLTSGTADYTIGTGATFNTTRPVKVEAWNHKTSSGQATGGKPVDAATFAAVARDRSAQGARIQALNYDAAYPNGSIHVYPKPLGGTLELWVWDALTQISDFTAALDYPPGYLQAISYNLALALAPKFGLAIHPGTKLMADQTRADLASANVEQHGAPPPAAAPPAAAPPAGANQ